jgi:hypothetical protein
VSARTVIRWLTLPQLAREMALTPLMARKDLRKVEWAYPRKVIQGRAHWDSRVLDLLRALRGQPHRTLEPAHSDWLAEYLKENPDAPTA